VNFPGRSDIFAAMRVSWVLALLSVACGVAHAEDTAPSTDQSGVVVNMGALSAPARVPVPRAKPSPDEMRPLAQVRPRPKPAFEAVAADAAAVAPVAAPVAAVPVPAVTPQPAALASSNVPLPRAKPTGFAGAPMAPIADGPGEAPTPPAAAPVVIVSAPTTTTDYGVEMRGIAQEVGGPSKPIDPTAGFSVMSRVRFPNGKTDIPATARATLDNLAQRLVATTTRVRLAGFSGKAGDRSSEARRLSLARALAIRAYLVSKGVPIDRVDVLAFGGASDGVTDRVDVLARGT
jgi:outer membrane protein OmpA-like peptidoglycan-associated protein